MSITCHLFFFQMLSSRWRPSVLEYSFSALRIRSTIRCITLKGALAISSWISFNKVHHYFEVSLNKLITFSTGECLDRCAKSDVRRFYWINCFRAQRLELVTRAALTAVTFPVYERFFFRTGFFFCFFFNALLVSSKSVIHISIALADCTESWRLGMKCKRNERCVAA